MVSSAEESKVVEVGGTVVSDPMSEMMGIAPRFGPVTIGEYAALVTERQSAPLHRCDEPGLPTHVEDLAAATHYDPRHGAVAQHSAQGLPADRLRPVEVTTSIGSGWDRFVARQRVYVDDGVQVGWRHARTFGTLEDDATHLDQSIGTPLGGRSRAAGQTYGVGRRHDVDRLREQGSAFRVQQRVNMDCALESRGNHQMTIVVVFHKIRRGKLIISKLAPTSHHLGEIPHRHHLGGVNQGINNLHPLHIVQSAPSVPLSGRISGLSARR